MPYLSQAKKNELNYITTQIVMTKFNHPGELNYLFTELIKQYLDTVGTNYEHINAVIGALECCKLEAYRRIAVPYENQKIKSNGDVYHADL